LTREAAAFKNKTLNRADVVSRCGADAVHLENKLKTFDIRFANAKTCAS